MAINHGSKRIVVGAHYGFRDWLSQRVTAAIMAIFTAVVLVQYLLTKGAVTYVKWSGIFAPQWMKALTIAVFAALGYHVWVGMRDVLMDYIKPVWLRLSCQVITIVWLLGCMGWAVQVLWRV